MKSVYLIANGDLRESANRTCEKEQLAMEAQIIAAFEREGIQVVRAHGLREEKGHSFIDSQKYGMEVFRDIPKDAPLVVAEAVWQYSHHVLPGLLAHQGPILTVANWSGTWPGLVGVLNLNGSLTKAGVRYSSLWSEDFTDAFFTNGLKKWLTEGSVTNPTPQVRAFSPNHADRTAVEAGAAIGRAIRMDQRIMGVFDEGCMGMYNAIIPDELIHQTGIFKERLSQSSLYAAMQQVTDAEAQAVYDWLIGRGVTFHFGANEESDLTLSQVLQQCKMYIAAVRIAEEFGCACVGIQYQQGLKDLAPASDLVEGILNNTDRPPVFDITGKEIRPGEAIPHFNEVDECAGLDGLVTYELWKKLGFEPENTLHDIRWARQFKDENLDAYVWVFLISGAAPPAHFIGGYAGTSSERQPSMYFRLGGGTCKGISKPGWIVWSRVFVEDSQLKCDIGLAEVVELPAQETDDRWKLTTPQWPIMHAVLQGITRDEMMARHKSNHIQVVYAPSKSEAAYAAQAKAAALTEMGLEVFLCGEI